MSPEDVLAWMHAAPAAPAESLNGDNEYAMPAEGVVSDLEAVDGGETETDTDYAHLYAQPKRRWMRWAIVGMLVGVIIGGVVFLVIKQRQFAAREGDMAREAEAALAENRFSQAQKDFDQLYKDFEKSKERGRYKFLSEFAGAMEAVYNGSDPPETRRRKFQEFQTSAESDEFKKPLWNERQTAVWQAYVRLLNDQVNIAQKAMDGREFDGASTAVDQAERMVEQIQSKGTTEAKNQIAAVPGRLEAFRATIADDRAYTSFVAKMNEAFKKLTPVVLAEYEGIAKKNRYQNRPEVVTAIQRAKDELKSRIVFKLDERPKQSPPKNDLPLLVVGAVRGGAAPANERVVFALARGVLYALTESTGHILWATRVGIDVASLPLRIPKGPNSPEQVLVPAPDNKGLIARDVQNGKALWMQSLEAPLRGQPVLVDRRVFVPLAGDEGRVVLIESFDGSRIGYLPLGQKLAGGGTWQTGTSRVFFPAENQNVFVIDTNPKPDPSGKVDPAVFEAMLATGHGAGTLRGAPIVVGGGTDESGAAVSPTYFIIAQADGLDGMKVRAFELALPRADLGVPVEFRLNGWSWFTPTCDQEKLAIATDSGLFAVFGVAQKGSEDKVLFPLVTAELLQGAARRSGRCQVVHADDRNFWYLINGELTMNSIGFARKDGQTLAPQWKQTLRLGTPLHAGQISADQEVLFVVTQTTSPPGCFATAVEAQTGAVRWQRALGVGIQGEAIRLGKFIYEIDQGGGIYQIDAAEVKLAANEDWTAGGKMLAPPRTDLVGEPRLITAADGKSAYVILTTRDGDGTNKLHVRQIVPDKPLIEHPAVGLGQETLHGPPAIVGESIFMPLSSGKLSRLTIGADSVVGGPDWKTAALGDDARGYVLPLGKDTLLVSNGVRGLSLFSWPASGFQFKRQASLGSRIVSAPLALPVESGTPRIVIADANGQVQLLDGDSLSPILTWNVRQMQLGTEVTSGPFLLDSGAVAKILIIVDRTHLICLASDARLPAWKYRVKGDGLAGAPRRVGNALILSDVSGRYEAIDAISGAALGSSFPALGALPAAPAASPIDGGDGRLFAPLSDGTMLLVPVEALTAKKN